MKSVLFSGFSPEPVLTDTQGSGAQPSEEMLSSQSELRSSKCPQDRELPSIPPNSALAGDGPPPSGDSTYEVSLEISSLWLF